jgi:hypothetical protein
MVQVRQGLRTAGTRASESSPFAWLAIAAAAALIFLLVIAAAESGGWDHLLPKDRSFEPYFTT